MGCARRVAGQWCLPMDLANKLFIVTGANTGIGKVTATELARGGATVLLACRNAAKTAPGIPLIRGKELGREGEWVNEGGPHTGGHSQ